MDAESVIEKYDPKATKGFENFPKEWYSYFRLLTSKLIDIQLALSVSFMDAKKFFLRSKIF